MNDEPRPDDAYPAYEIVVMDKINATVRLVNCLGLFVDPHAAAECARALNSDPEKRPIHVYTFREAINE